MILRKPYGFLIKHFRLIHLILLGLFLYLSIKVSNVLGYYNDFISGSASKLDAVKYMTNYYIFVIILAIIICLIVYALMRYKKKPRVLYLLLILLCFLTGVMLQVSYSGLYTIYISSIETKTLRLYRDLLRILSWIEYIPLVILLIRGLGFDIKKFNFVGDLAELGEDATDSEEIELTLGGTEVTRRKIHRGFREFKYYYLENKTFIHIILIVMVVIGISTFTVNKEIINKVYEEGESFSTDNFNFNVTDSYITNKGSNGSLVGDLEHSFVGVRIVLSSRNGKRVFNTANLILKTESSSYSPNVRYASYFSDLGTVYQKYDVSGDEAFIFLYMVLNDELEENMELVYANDKTVNLKPVSLEKTGKSKDVNMGGEINLSDTVMKEGSFKINSYDIQEKFSYSYDYEVRGEKFTSAYSITGGQGAVMLLNISSSYRGDMSNFSFLNSYGTLYYKVGDEEKSSKFYDKTPGTYNEGVYLSVDKDITNASSIWFSIKVRNKLYKYILK